MRQLARWWNWLLLAGAAGAAVLALALLLAPRLGLIGPPRLEWSMPADGAANVLPRTPLRLIFSEPMDRASVEQALRVEPPLPGAWQWDDARSATWTPAPGWT
ncbi:MAG TPA: Ig-like domain-containing protein, partial [Herpetosiphonaceae bacterium]